MDKLERCEDMVDYLLTQGGGVVLSDKHEGSNGCMARNVVIQRDCCSIKISYLNLGDKQIVVQTTCCCEQSNGWKSLDWDCLSVIIS